MFRLYFLLSYLLSVVYIVSVVAHFFIYGSFRAAHFSCCTFWSFSLVHLVRLAVNIIILLEIFEYITVNMVIMLKITVACEFPMPGINNSIPILSLPTKCLFSPFPEWSIYVCHKIDKSKFSEANESQ